MAEAFPAEDNPNDELPVEFGAPWPGRYMLLVTKWGSFMQSIAVDPSKAGLFVDETLEHIFRDATIENRLLLFSGQENEFAFGKFVLTEETPDGRNCIPTKLQELKGVMLRTDDMTEDERAGIIHSLHFDRICDITRNREAHGYIAMWPMDDKKEAERSFRKIQTWIPDTGNRLILQLPQEEKKKARLSSAKLASSSASSSAEFVDIQEFPGVQIRERFGNAEPIEIAIPPKATVIDPRSVYVSGLPARFNNEDMLRTSFAPYGKIAKCKPSKNDGEKAYIMFKDRAGLSAINAVNHMIEMAVAGDVIVEENVKIERVHMGSGSG